MNATLIRTSTIDADFMTAIEDMCHTTIPSELSNLYIELRDGEDFNGRQEVIDLIGYYCQEYWFAREDAFHSAFHRNEYEY